MSSKPDIAQQKFRDTLFGYREHLFSIATASPASQCPVQCQEALADDLPNVSLKSLVDILNLDDGPELINSFVEIESDFEKLVFEKALFDSRSLFKFMDDQLHCYNYSEVPAQLLTLYCFSCMSLSLSLCLVGLQDQLFCDKKCFFRLAEALRYLDLAVIVSGPPLPFSKWIFGFLETIQPLLPKPEETQNKVISISPNSSIKSSLPLNILHVNLKQHPILRITSPSIEEFLNLVVYPKKPAILEDCIDFWPAFNCRPWSDLDFLKSHLGPYRTIPVEIGRQYTDNDWSQTLMTVECFFKHHLNDPDEGKIGYLAQHDIFRQFPHLQNDVYIPDYCFVIPPTVCASVNQATSDPEVLRHGWLGPGKTKTPLHCDPYHNLFAQVVGTKSFILFPLNRKIIYISTPKTACCQTHQC
ncbi:Lysine-specific demethylase 8 [Entomophthora muscae]|uniref:Lysine-specific demethylase 8 n=1 Tax=Entomophthora muscae TaxID=34485 RepID=A0ACC2TYA9_9FUNG|nr:Lysine-specific demethylase 8 [Entomophthora muscae]